MEILVINSIDTIFVWLAGEPLSSAADHIRNGYPQLQSDYDAGIIKPQIITVADDEVFRPDLYAVVDGTVVRTGGGA